jgi:DNA-binding LytR/AlgR family response regulator
LNYYRVGICDDEEIFLEKIYHLVKSNLINLNCDFVVNRFNKAKDLILSNYEEDYNIIFLDIDMPRTNGIEAAIALKQSSLNIVIVFITSKDELVFESIKTHPFRAADLYDGEVRAC